MFIFSSALEDAICSKMPDVFVEASPYVFQMAKMRIWGRIKRFKCKKMTGS